MRTQERVDIGKIGINIKKLLPKECYSYSASIDKIDEKLEEKLIRLPITVCFYKDFIDLKNKKYHSENIYIEVSFYKTPSGRSVKNKQILLELL